MKPKKENKALSQEEKALSSYNTKLVVEGVFKSLFLALAAGFLLSVIVSIISFALLKNILWVSLVVWAVTTAGLTVLFYFKRYRPDVKSTAMRVDETGLEERVITMMQFKDQDNPMLKLQREDAQVALEKVSVKQVKMRFPKLLIILLAVFAVIGVFMMSYSTALAVNSENAVAEQNQEELSEEDKIILALIKALREEIDAAEIDEALRDRLHGIVDDLEKSIKPTDTIDVKVAKVMDAADKIHKLIDEYLNRATIGDELMKHDTTYNLGKAINSKDIEKIRDAFQKMYDSIEPLVKKGAFDILNQTADDIDESLNAAKNTPPELQKALEDLRDAFRRVFSSLEDMKGQLEDAFKDENLSQEEMDQLIQDAMQDAMEGAMEEIRDAMDQAADAMESFFDQQSSQNEKYEGLDQALQDAFKDAMGQLGQDFEYPEDPEENEGDGSGKSEFPEDNKVPGESDTELGGSQPGHDNKDTVDTVIDGETSYKDVFDDGGYSGDIQDKLESGELTDEDRQIIQDYFDSL